MKTSSDIWLAARGIARDLAQDRNGLAATEFAIIVPMIMVMFFGTVEFSSAVAVDRKVTLIARTLSDLTSQATLSVDDPYLTNVFTASISVMSGYDPTPTKAQITQIYVDANKVARVQWSKAATIGSAATQATLGTSTHNSGDVLTIPTELQVPKTYLIYSEVSYSYKPTIGYVMKSAVTLSDVAYTRPRQSTCVLYGGQPAGCPTTS
jgi:Flp pilus assembly protein TadG